MALPRELIDEAQRACVTARRGLVGKGSMGSMGSMDEAQRAAGDELLQDWELAALHLPGVCDRE